MNWWHVFICKLIERILFPYRKVYDCVFCDKLFNSMKEYRYHTDAAHLGFEQNVHCPYCNAALSRSTIRDHVKLKHKYNEICPYCAFASSSLVKFRYHMMTVHNDTSHGTVMIYKCDMCSFQSYDKSSKDRHMRNVHLGKFNHNYNHYRCWEKNVRPS